MRAHFGAEASDALADGIVSGTERALCETMAQEELHVTDAVALREVSDILVELADEMMVAMAADEMRARAFVMILDAGNFGP